MIKLTDTQTAAILTSVQRRIEAHGLTVKKGKKALTLESDIMAGVMITLNTLLPNDDPNQLSPTIPPMWYLAPMTGRSVFDS